ncbi:MAG TPA: site-specific DNA-methyltransferase, partial [Gemmatimonadales bacterium]
MLPLADECVDLIVTSPPYFGLRSYTDGGEHYEGQIGLEATPAQFLDALIGVTAEMIRVLKPSGSIWVNLGDKYCASGRGPDGSSSGLSNGAQFRVGNGIRPADCGVRKKSLLGLPWRYAIRCMDELGLILREEIIWDKPNGLPESVADRCRRSHEQWFHFTREPHYYSAVDEIREPHLMRPQRRPAGRPADLTSRPGATRQAWSMTSRDEPGPDGHPLGKLPGSVWS